MINRIKTKPLYWNPDEWEEYNAWMDEEEERERQENPVDEEEFPPRAIDDTEDLRDLNSDVHCDCCDFRTLYMKGAPMQLCEECIGVMYRSDMLPHVTRWYERRFADEMDDPSFTLDMWYGKREKEKPVEASPALPALRLNDHIMTRLNQPHLV